MSSQVYTPYPTYSVPRLLSKLHSVISVTSCPYPPRSAARHHLALPLVITSLSGSLSLRSVARLLVGEDGTEHL
ncbi:MAG: hypothetical protein IJR02_09795 [Bacteroidaceae bacterium]|nr:hypothetical protein [Bacteroidaceae bacterium]